MTVVHLGERITHDEALFDSQKSSQVSLLLVNDGASVERFSLELTIGSVWAKVFSTASKSFSKIDANGVLIGRHDSIVVEVAEDIRVPNNMYGILMPTGSLFLGLGILIAPAKIEPGFSGKLTLRLFNTTAEKHTLKMGQKIGSAIFFPTDTTVEHRTIKRERDATAVPYTRRKRIWDWLKANPVIWLTLLINAVGSSTVAAIITLSLQNNK